MLAYFIIGLALLIGLIVGANALAQADPKSIIRGFRIAAAIVLGALATLFVFTGRFALAPPLAILAIFLLSRKPLFPKFAPSSGQKSEVKTDWLHAILDHDSGKMDAMILKGQFEEKKLSDLDLADFRLLLEELENDPQSSSIVQTFMNREFGDHENDTEYNHDRASSSEKSTENKVNGMSMAEALEILELEPGANQEEIRAAHKRLMKKYHPDHGGSAYMAAKLNQAKDLLVNN